MIEKRNIFIFILCSIILIGLPRAAISKVSMYSDGIDAILQYDNNVTRERLPENYQYGIIWKIYTGFGIKQFIPVEGLNTEAKYSLGMRDVNTTNDEDYNSHRLDLKSSTTLKMGTKISLEEALELWNSQSDLFNFYQNTAMAEVIQPFGRKTRVNLSYTSKQKRFQNRAPAVRARNSIQHQIDMGVNHRISDAFTVVLGYSHLYSMYNRSPIDFIGGRQVVLEGVQRDRQNVIKMGFQAFLFNNTTVLEVSNQFVDSNSNSRAFDYSGNRAAISILSNPLEKLWVNFTYRIVAYKLGAYQTPDMGYELGEIRTDDQSGITLGVTYDISKQVDLLFNYEHIKNTVFLTKEFYEEDIFSMGLKIRF